MLTPFVTALVAANCVAGFCLVGTAALVCSLDSLKKFSGTGLDGGAAATNSFFRLGRGSWPTF
jgi:hypothetical protein